MHHSYFLDYLWLIPLFPLASAFLMLVIGRSLSKRAVDVLCVGSVFLSFLHSAGAVWQLLGLPPEQRAVQNVLFDWVGGVFRTSDGRLGDFVAEWGVLLDPLSAVMILVVSGVGFIIHVYSTGYMAHEDGYYRFFGYMNLFMFSMLTLVMANNLLLMFVGWEGVGTCSYLLIGFYYLKKSASDAGKKAFIVNRMGDAGFLLGLFLLSATLGTITFSSAGRPGLERILAIPEAVAISGLGVGAPVWTAIALLLFVGATGKSAQIPLYTWLPDAMEGPTPVSALIHAATMVTAGVYMVARMNLIFQQSVIALEVVAFVGALTAMYAATMGLVQTDIKRVLAYSTISQLGYMFLACGVGAFVSGIFHLMTHAFFKALLFLGAGSVIHALSGEQDLEKMGALWKKIPVTAKTMLVGTIAIAGFPPLAGFVSKDLILEKTFSREADIFFKMLWGIGILTAGMTAFYMFRLFNLAFQGGSRVAHDAEHHVHESPKSMTVPLMVLAFLSVVGGWIGWPKALGGGEWFSKFLEPVVAHVPVPGEAAHPHLSHFAEYSLMATSVAIAAAGYLLAQFIYLRREGLADALAVRWHGIHNLLYRKYYMDEIYDALFVNRTKDLASTMGAFDRGVIDGVGVDGTAWLTRFSSRISIFWDTWIVDGSVRLGSLMVWLSSYPVRMTQTGLVQSYALLIFVGVLLYLGFALLGAPELRGWK